MLLTLHPWQGTTILTYINEASNQINGSEQQAPKLFTAAQREMLGEAGNNNVGGEAGLFAYISFGE